MFHICIQFHSTTGLSPCVLGICYNPSFSIFLASSWFVNGRKQFYMEERKESGVVLVFGLWLSPWGTAAFWWPQLLLSRLLQWQLLPLSSGVVPNLCTFRLDSENVSPVQ